MSSSADEAKALHSGLPPAEKRGPASVRRRIGRKVHGKEKKILVAKQPECKYRKYWLHNELQLSVAEALAARLVTGSARVSRSHGAVTSLAHQGVGLADSAIHCAKQLLVAHSGHDLGC